MALNLDDEDHIINLSYDLLQLGQRKQAMNTLLPYTAPPDASSRILWHSAHMARLNAHPLVAIELLKRAIEQAPKVTQLYLDLADCLIGQRATTEAINVLQKCYTATQNHKAKAKEALLHFKEDGNPIPARNYLNEIDRSAPGEAPSGLHALIAITDGDWPAALQHSLDFIELPSPDEKTHVCALAKSHPIYDITPSSERLTITIGTSLSPKGGQDQIDAIQSWTHAVQKIISVNTPEEIAILQPDFPQVCFVEASSTKTSPINKPLIFIDDILEALKDSQTDLCAIVNGDIVLLSEAALQEEISVLGQKGMTFLHREDLPSKTSTSGKLYRDGLDAFLFAPDHIPVLQGSHMQLGSPWWDYMFPILALQNNIPTHIPIRTIIGHILHPVNWSMESYLKALPSWLRDIQDMASRSTNITEEAHPAYLSLVHPLIKILDQEITNKAPPEFNDLEFAPDTHLTPHTMIQIQPLIEGLKQHETQALAQGTSVNTPYFSAKSMMQSMQFALIISSLINCHSIQSPLRTQ